MGAFGGQQRPALIAAVVLLVTGCARPQREAVPRNFDPPKLVLWAWDRAEDLRFLKPGEAEVAALMETLYLRDGQTSNWSRKLPLILPEGIEPIAVIRIESDGTALPQADAVASFLWRWMDHKRIQIDFDARSSQRGWYLELIHITRRWRRHISITALASWCLEKPWFDGAPDEAVPMLFRMGPQRNSILDRLQKQGHFGEGCRDAIGISTDERLGWRPEAKKIYLFHPQRWTREAFDEVRSRLHSASS